MSANFFPTRGCVYAIPSEGGTNGLYKLDGITDQKGDGSAILITGLDMMDSDVVAPVVTTEDLKVLYVFGKAFGRANIQGQILLGQAGKSNEKLTKVQQFFEDKRIGRSSNSTPTQLSVGEKAYWVYFTGLAIGAVDSEFNIQSFSLEGLIADNA